MYLVIWVGHRHSYYFSFNCQKNEVELLAIINAIDCHKRVIEIYDVAVEGQIVSVDDFAFASDGEVGDEGNREVNHVLLWIEDDFATFSEF